MHTECALKFREGCAPQPSESALLSRYTHEVSVSVSAPLYQGIKTIKGKIVLQNSHKRECSQASEGA